MFEKSTEKNSFLGQFIELTILKSLFDLKYIVDKVGSCDLCDLSTDLRQKNMLTYKSVRTRNLNILEVQITIPNYKVFYSHVH